MPEYLAKLTPGETNGAVANDESEHLTPEDVVRETVVSEPDASVVEVETCRIAGTGSCLNSGKPHSAQPGPQPQPNSRTGGNGENGGWRGW